MSSLYEVLPGIQPTANEILEAELFAQQILQAQYPDLDLREGTAIRDLVLRPTATLMAILNKGTAYYFAQNTIKGISDTSPTDFLDGVMSNWFMTRKQGTNAVISARLFFARQKSVSISTNTFFSTDNSLKFYPSSSVSMSSTALTFDAYSNEYYIDLNLVAEQSGASYNISSGSLLYFSNFDPYFLRAEINYLSQAADDTETNTQFITRAGTAISTRNLINAPSIVSNLEATFSTVTDISSIGFGDPEMIRDLVSVLVPGMVSPVLLHTGGMVDVYCNVPLSSTIVQLTADTSGNLLATGPIYSITRSNTSGSSVADTVPLTVSAAVSLVTSSGNVATVILPSHGYTNGQSVTISGATPTGYNGTFIITVVDINTFTYAIVGPLTSPATGVISSAIDTPFTVTNPNTISRALTSLSSSLGVATATLVNHGLPAGRYVTISGATPSEYNGSFLVNSVTKDTFSFTVASGLASPATGVVVATSVNPVYDVGFSGRQSLNIAMGAGNASRTASFTIKYYDYLESFQTYLEDPANRVVCADLLARGFNMYRLDVTITAYNGPAPDPVICTDTLHTYLAGLKPGQIFIMADLLAMLSAAGVTTIKTPILITYNSYTRDLLPPVTGTITDYLDPADRTSIFLLNSLVTNNQVV